MKLTVDNTQMATAHLWAQHSTCTRARVGAVISSGGRAIGTGYNGAPAGMPHCDHSVRHEPKIQDTANWDRRVSPVPPMRTLFGCRTALHAETNAIAYAARHGVSVAGATLYVTMSPCHPCAQLIVAAGLHRVVYDDAYRDPAGIEFLLAAGLVVEKCL